MTSINVFGEHAAKEIREQLPQGNCVYVCIGTQQVLSDSLGPAVGTLVNEKMQQPLTVYGLYENNITAVNLHTAYRLIRLLHPDATIVVIDAAVGDEEEVGTVQCYRGPMRPGAATNKNLPDVGDFSILGVVSQRGLKDFYTTCFDRLKLVNRMAVAIADAICGT